MSLMMEICFDSDQGIEMFQNKHNIIKKTLIIVSLRVHMLNYIIYMQQVWL